VTGAGVSIYLARASYPAPCARGESGAGLAVSGNGTVTLTATASTTGSAGVPVDLGASSAPLVSTSTTTYTYNGADELVGLSGPGLAASYTYNGDGLRASATTNGSTQQFTWDETGSELLADGANDYLYGPGGQVLEQVSKATGAAVFLHTDQLGSVRLLTDASGAVVGSASYSAYGSASYSAYGSVVSSTGTVTTPFGFAGGHTDPSGLIYLVHRYYEPATAQFISVDPLIAVTGEAYSYGGGDPVNVVDPAGLAGAEIDCNRCQQLQGLIQDLSNELTKRAQDLQENKLNLPSSGLMSIAGHQQQFENKQTKLRRFLNE
jgi:RHS repeat-associated protein